MAILDALKKNKDESPKGEKISKKKEEVSSSVKKPKESKSEKKDMVVTDKNIDKAQQKEVTLQNILKHPRITEKAAILAERNVYTFEVDPHAGKIEIARAVKQIYNVEVVRVNIIKLPAKKVTIRGKRGVKSAIKKALVYLKEGDKIEFV